jgi:hypothetical protein
MPPIDSSDEDESLHINIRQLQRITKELKTNNQVSTAVLQLCEIVERVHLQNELLRHDNMLYKDVLKDTREKKKRGKAMGFLKEDEPKFGQFYSPERVTRIRAEEAIKETEEMVQKQANLETKLQKAIQKEWNEEERQLQAAIKKREREEKKAQKATEAAARQLKREAVRQQRKLEVEAKKASKRSPIKKQSVIHNLVDLEMNLAEGSSSIPVARSGRKINLPPRFQD